MTIKRRIQRWIFESLGMGVLTLPLLLYAIPHFQRPPQVETERSLFSGISYRRQVRDRPRPAVIHILRVDLSSPGVGVRVTPGNPTPDDTEISARTTSQFLREFGLQVAVNASFFYVFQEKTPWDFYPRSGDRVNTIGQSISNGVEYSPPQRQWYVLCFRAGLAQIPGGERCPAGTQQAVAGIALLVKNGKPTPADETLDNATPYPRTVAAINRSGKTLWLIAVDGKQPLYSEGMTLAEVTEIAVELGADAAVNLDGGGSTTIAAARSTGVELLNAPAQNKAPMWERPIANHIGFYAEPLKNATHSTWAVCGKKSAGCTRVNR